MTTFNTRVTFDHVRNTAAGFTAANPVLGYGVTGLETDSGKIKIGDGVTAWATLPYSGGGPVEWSNVQGKPSTFAPSAHQHPISDVNGLQAALDSKATPANVTAAGAAAAADATTKANSAQAAAVQRANHTGTQAIATVDGLQTALDGKVATSDSRLTDAREWSAATVTQAEAEAGTSTDRRAFTPVRVFQAIAAWWAGSAAKTKLDGIASGATVNATDAQLRDRATHTGTQAASTITGLSTVATTGAYADLSGKPTLFDGSYTSLINVPSTFTPAAHNQAWSTITSTPTTLAGYGITDGVVSSDSRLSDARTPTDGSVTDAKIATAGLSASSINWTGVTAWAANTSYAKGALVHYLNITYQRSTAGTTGATFNAANWQQMTAPVNVTTTPSQITGNANDYALAIAANDIFRISSDAARNITGITAGLFDGHAILLRNVGSFAITLRHQDAASAAANRIISPWAGDVVISANASMLLVYDSTLSRWVVT